MKSFLSVIEKAQKMGPFTISVAGAEDYSLLMALKDAQDLGFVNPVLVGDSNQIESLSTEIGLRPLDIINSKSPEDSGAIAVSLVKNGSCDILMKGMINTSIYMRAILNKEHGLRTNQLISLLAAYEIPEYHKLLFCTDSGINVAPNLEQKKDIVNNALSAMQSLGIQRPKVAVLTANEMVDAKVQSTVDAKALVDMATIGQVMPCIIEGPISFDIAFSPKAAEHKGINSNISGDCDLLVFPNIETGNALGKSWLHFNKAKWAGIVLGASKPVILGSRSDTNEIKINSIALGCLASSV